MVVQSLRQAKAAFMRHQGQSLWRDVEVIQISAAISSDFQHVLEARRHDQRNRRQPVLHNGIRNAGGAVNEAGDVIRLQANRR
jgi:hypothetical protein